MTDRVRSFAVALLLSASGSGLAQSPPSDAEVSAYTDLHLAAHRGEVSQVESLIADGADLEQVDGSGRTALHIAAFASHEDVVLALAAAVPNSVPASNSCDASTSKSPSAASISLFGCPAELG